MTRVVWHGHACIEIVTNAGVSIVIDPHDGVSLGIEPPKTKADLVLVTHEHFDHNATMEVSKEDTITVRPTHIREQFKDMTFNVRGVEIKVRALRAYHDTLRRNGIYIYVIYVDDLVFAHLGDIGHVPEPEQVKYMMVYGPINVLFLPVGGTFTIGPDEAVDTIVLIKPNIAVPIHYKYGSLELPLEPVTKFVSKAKKAFRVEKIDSNYFEVKPESLPPETTVYVLKPP